MSTKELKEKIREQVDKLSDEHLKVVKSYLEELNSNVIIPELGCTVEEYNRELDEADAAIRRGEYYTQEEAFNYINERLAKYRHADKVE